jgi:hypothetical protein
MPASSLSNLSSSEVLQLAVQLGDPRVGLPASAIRWLLDWAEKLDAAAVKAFGGKQLFDLLQLLADATAQDGSGSDIHSSSSGARVPSGQLLGLLCWAAADAVSTASAQQVYCLIRALASWWYTPPNGDVLLSAAAARVAEKLPMLDQMQLSDVLCGFAQLGFTVGEPLQSKLCSRLLQASTAAASTSSSGRVPTGAGGNAAAQMQLESTAAVLAAVVVSISSPPAQLVPTLMQQLDGRLQELPVESLLQVGAALAAAGMAVQEPAGAGAGAAPRSGSQRKSSSWISQEWGQQYLAAVERKLQKFPLSAQQLALACSSLHQLGLKANESTAEAAVKLLQKHLEASSSGIHMAWLVPVVSYITESRFRPAAQGIAIIEQQLLVVLRNGNSSSTSTELVLEAVGSSADSSNEGGVSAHDGVAYTRQAQAVELEQEQLLLRLADFVQLLKAMHDWGRRPGPDFTAAAQDWSRHQLINCDVHTLGPLLLWLSSVCGKPSAAWMLDWVAVSQPLLLDATAVDLMTLVVALSASGASAGGVSTAWWDGFSTAVLRKLQDMTDDSLEILCSSCYKLRYRPSQAWLDSVLGEVQMRAPDSSQNTAAARAIAWARQLKVA